MPPHFRSGGRGSFFSARVHRGARIPGSDCRSPAWLFSPLLLLFRSEPKAMQSRFSLESPDSLIHENLSISILPYVYVHFNSLSFYCAETAVSFYCAETASWTEPGKSIALHAQYPAARPRVKGDLVCWQPPILLRSAQKTGTVQQFPFIL